MNFSSILNFDVQNILEYWRKPLLYLVISILLILIIYTETVVPMARKWWESETYAHGMVILPLTLYMIWTRRRILVNLHPSTTWWGLAILLPSLIIWFIGSLVDAMLLKQFAVLGMLWSVILCLLGWEVIKKIIFPLGFLIFAIPAGEAVIPFLRDITAIFTVKALQLSGFPVYWEGMSFSIPSGSFEVAKACSGVRYLFASVALGCLFAYINFSSYKKRIIFILVSAVLPVIANGVRAYGIVLIAHFSGMKYAVGVDHIIYGWIFFGVIMYMLFYIGNKWREDRTENDCVYEGVVFKASPRRLTLITIILLLSSIGPIVQQSQSDNLPIPGEAELPTPLGKEQWKNVTQDNNSSWGIEFKGVDKEVKGIYSAAQQIVKLYMGYYAAEVQGKELINQVNQFYNYKHWVEVERRKQTLVIGKDKINMQIKILERGEQERILWYWYDLNGYTTASSYFGKLIQAWHRLIYGEKGGAVVVVISDVLVDRETASERIDDFLHIMYPEIKLSLKKAYNTY